MIGGRRLRGVRLALHVVGILGMIGAPRASGHEIRPYEVRPGQVRLKPDATYEPGLVLLQTDHEPRSTRLDVPTALQGGPIDRALQAGNLAEAQTLLVAAIERTPAPRDLLVLLGRVFLADRKPLNAAIALKKAEALGPLDEPARFVLALSYVSMGRGDWARPELEKLHAHSAAPIYGYWLGRLDYDAGHFASAVRRFKAFVARETRSVRGYDNLGLAYDAVNDHARALAAHRRAVMLNRAAAAKSPWPPLNLGIMLAASGEHAEAESLLREAVSYDAGLARAHYHLGVLLEQTGRGEEARASLERAVAADAAYAEPHYALARIHRSAGRKAEAASALAAFARLHDVERKEGVR